MDEEDRRHEVNGIDGTPGLYLTDWVGAASVNEANILGITHILSILTAEEFERYGPDESKDVVLWHLELKDEEASDILQYFPVGCDWIDKALSSPGPNGSQGGVIVHCQQGISRSAAIVVAYLMKKRSLSYDEAMKLVKKARSIVHLNAGFEEQLRVWERKLHDSRTAAEPTSPKSAVDEINAQGLIDYVERREG